VAVTVTGHRKSRALRLRRQVVHLVWGLAARCVFFGPLARKTAAPPPATNKSRSPSSSFPPPLPPRHDHIAPLFRPSSTRTAVPSRETRAAPPSPLCHIDSRCASSEPTPASRERAVTACGATSTPSLPGDANGAAPNMSSAPTASSTWAHLSAALLVCGQPRSKTAADAGAAGRRPTAIPHHPPAVTPPSGRRVPRTPTRYYRAGPPPGIPGLARVAATCHQVRPPTRDSHPAARAWA